MTKEYAKAIVGLETIRIASDVEISKWGEKVLRDPLAFVRDYGESLMELKVQAWLADRVLTIAKGDDGEPTATRLWEIVEKVMDATTRDVIQNIGYDSGQQRFSFAGVYKAMWCATLASEVTKHNGGLGVFNHVRSMMRQEKADPPLRLPEP